LNHFCNFLGADIAPDVPTGYVRGVGRPFPKFLKQLMDERQINIQELHERTGFSRTTLYRHLNGETFPSRKDRKIYAQFFHFPNVEEFDQGWRANGTGQQKGDPHGGIPVLAEVPGGNGDDGRDSYDNGIGHEGYVSRSVVGVQDPKAYCVRVKGDSMAPLLMDGELIACSPQAVEEKGFEDGKIYAIRFTPERDSEATVKRVFIDPRDPEMIELRPENPRHPTKRIRLDWIIRAAKVVARVQVFE
jgi:phage repressor protein C with HTH and peptisase S24 domain